MLQLTPQSTVFVATIYVDFRKGIDGLIAICRQKLFIEPLNGAVFLFYNKTRTTIKVLSYDGQGFWLCTKRLSKGRFKFKPFDNSINHDPNTNLNLNNPNLNVTSKPTNSSKYIQSSGSDPKEEALNYYQQICYRSLHILINDGDPVKADLSKNWRNLNP